MVGKSTAVLALLLTALLVSACHRLERGVVVDKQHVPAHTETYWDSVCVVHDPKTGACTVEVPVQRTRHIADTYEVWLRGYDAEGVERTEAFASGQGVYSWVKVGDSCDASSGRLLCNRGASVEGPVR